MIAAWTSGQERERSLAMASARDELENNPTSPVIGNPEGSTTVVEFFDHRCGYCKRVLPSIRKLIEEDRDVRWMLKEFPILGPNSVTATRASLAVWNLAPDTFMDYHVALMSTRGELTEDKVLAVAADIGLDQEAIKAEMAKPHIAQTIERNLDLARRLQLQGTRAFIIGGELVPGALSLERMQELIVTAGSS